MGIRVSRNMMKVALISLFFSTAASAGILDSCAKAFWILSGKADHYVSAPILPKAFALKRKIIRRLSELGGHRIHVIEESYRIGRSDYLKGLANLSLALEDTDPIWNRIKLSSITIGNSSRMYIDLDLFGLPYAYIPYNMATRSLSSDLSIRLLEFGIERKLKKDRTQLYFINKGLSDNQYKGTLEAFYNALEKGPIPEELGKLRDVIITRKGGISSSWSRLTDEDILQTDLNIPAHAIEDLEGLAIGVLESEVGARLARDYAYTGLDKGIGNAIVGAGVDRQTYREVLKKMVKKLAEGHITVESFRPEGPDSIGLKNLARIHITEGGRDFTRERDDNLFDLYLPAGIILDDAPLSLPSSVPLLPNAMALLIARHFSRMK